MAPPHKASHILTVSDDDVLLLRSVGNRNGFLLRVTWHLKGGERNRVTPKSFQVPTDRNEMDLRVVLCS